MYTTVVTNIKFIHNFIVISCIGIQTACYVSGIPIGQHQHQNDKTRPVFSLMVLCRDWPQGYLVPNQQATTLEDIPNPMDWND